MSERDFFGEIAARLEAPPMSDVERKRMYRRTASVPRGHAAKPGSGPAGETCGSCRHLYRQDGASRTFPKCGLNRAGWTHGPKTDVRVRDPACAKWEAA